MTALAQSLHQKTRRPGGGTPEVTWGEITARAPRMAATMASYLEQLEVSSRPATVSAPWTWPSGFSPTGSPRPIPPACRWPPSDGPTSRTSRPGRPLVRGGEASHRRPPQSDTGSACCARSSSGSSSGTTTMLRPDFRSTRATFPPSTTPCPSSWTTRRRPGSWPRWPSRSESSTSPHGRAVGPHRDARRRARRPRRRRRRQRSETSTSSGSRSASCTTIATSPCCPCCSISSSTTGRGVGRHIPDTWSSEMTGSHSTGAPSSATSPAWPSGPGSVTSTLTSCATPWPPSRSTGA